MRIGTRDRFWLLGGLVVALVLVLVAWQFFIKSQSDETTSVKQDIDSAQTQVLSAQHSLNQLRADNADLAKYQAQLAADQQALPSDPAIPAFLTELQEAGNAAGVGVSQLQISDAQPLATATATKSPVYKLTLSLLATGSVDGITAFLKQIQAVQPRAVLLQSVNEAPASSANGVQLNVTFQLFVAPPDGKLPTAS